MKPQLSGLKKSGVDLHFCGVLSGGKLFLAKISVFRI
jgi:hypothetical protein